jgi:hypothetical protein
MPVFSQQFKRGSPVALNVLNIKIVLSAKNCDDWFLLTTTSFELVCFFSNSNGDKTIDLSMIKILRFKSL